MVPQVFLVSHTPPPGPHSREACPSTVGKECVTEGRQNTEAGNEEAPRIRRLESII